MRNFLVRNIGTFITVIAICGFFAYMYYDWVDNNSLRENIVAADYEHTDISDSQQTIRDLEDEKASLELELSDMKTKQEIIVQIYEKFSDGYTNWEDVVEELGEYMDN